MKRLALVMITAMLLVAGCATFNYGPMTDKTDNFNVTADFSKNPPIAGENSLIISIKDAKGNEITDAAVQVDYFMSEKRIASRAYVAMPKHGSVSDGEAKDNAYKAKLNFTMSGPWHIDVLIMRDGKEQTAHFFTLVK